MRKLVSLLTLAVVLALPASTFAANTSGTVSESGTAAVSVSATIPTSASYTLTNTTFNATIPVSAISSTFSGGLTMTATPNSGGSNVFDPTKRAIAATGTGWTATPGAATEGYWSTASSKPIASRSGDASSDSVSLASSVRVTTAGSYTGTLQIVITTTN